LNLGRGESGCILWARGGLRSIRKIAKFDVTIAMRIRILAPNDAFDTSLTAVLDALGTANSLVEMTGISSRTGPLGVFSHL